MLFELFKNKKKVFCNCLRLFNFFGGGGFVVIISVVATGNQTIVIAQLYSCESKLFLAATPPFSSMDLFCNLIGQYHVQSDRIGHASLDVTIYYYNLKVEIAAYIVWHILYVVSH